MGLMQGLRAGRWVEPKQWWGMGARLVPRCLDRERGLWGALPSHLLVVRL